MKVFPEPRLLIFARGNSIEESKGLMAAEKQVLLEIDNFTITTGLTLPLLDFKGQKCKWILRSPKSICVYAI